VFHLVGVTDKRKIGLSISMKMKSMKAIILYGSIIVLAVGCTVASFGFVRPVDCHSYCNASDQTPCPPGACRDGEQRAGLPFPVLVDNAGGSSPTSGWGILGPEDLPNPITFVLDVFFYSVLLRFVVYLISIVRGKEPEVEHLAIILPLVVLLLGVLGGLALYGPYLTK
jgi:hypothetical protein